jgi:hypothetical protein
LFGFVLGKCIHLEPTRRKEDHFFKGWMRIGPRLSKSE